jgi:hypothetical protein
LHFLPPEKIGGMFPDNVLSDALFHSIVTQCSERSDLYGIGFTLQNEPLTDPGIFKRSDISEIMSNPGMTFLDNQWNTVKPVDGQTNCSIPVWTPYI